jgi:hypothetical protein
LDPLHFFVVLNLLRVRWVLNLAELRLQVVQYFFDLTCCAFDVFIKLTPLLNRSYRCVCRSE